MDGGGSQMGHNPADRADPQGARAGVAQRGHLPGTHPCSRGENSFTRLSLSERDCPPRAGSGAASNAAVAADEAHGAAAEAMGVGGSRPPTRNKEARWRDARDADKPWLLPQTQAACLNADTLCDDHSPRPARVRTKVGWCVGRLASDGPNPGDRSQGGGGLNSL